MDWTVQLSSSEKDLVYDPLIPPLVPQFMGREREKSHITHLCRRDTGTITIHGLPGVGKTTVALSLAYDPHIRAKFLDGILWVGLGPKPDVNGQLSRWASLFGISNATIGPLDMETRKNMLCNAIGDRRMLLILDDVWEIEDALAFKVGGPFCTHLFTTRFLTIAKQITSGDPVLLHEFSEEWSLDLLHRLAPSVVEQEPTKARTLVQAVGGLPLALTLAGNYLRLQTGQSRRVQEALERLTDAQMRLYLAASQGLIERHSAITSGSLSLHAIIAVSDERLPGEVRASLYALSVLPTKPDSFSEAAAFAVCNCSTAVLAVLVDVGLLEIAGDDRYTLHQSIADYAHAHLATTEPYERLIQYATELVETHQTRYEHLERESGTILDALDVAYEQEKKTDLIRIICAFAPFLIMRGNYSVAEQHLRRAHTAALEADDKPGIINTCLYIGQTGQKTGKYEQSRDMLQKGLDLARQLAFLAPQTYSKISALLRELGWMAWKQGNYSLSEKYLQEGLEIARSLGDSEQIGGILALLGAVTARTGNIVSAEACLREGLTLARQVENHEQICLILMNLGVAVAEQGNYSLSEKYFQEGLVLAQQIGHCEWMSALLCNLGAIEKDQQNYRQAEMYQREGLAVARKIGHREWMSILLLNLGETATAQERHTQASLYFEEAVKLAQQLGRPQLQARALYEQGNLYLKQQQFEMAQAAFDEMHAATPNGDVELNALYLYGKARLVAEQGNIQEARVLGEESIARFHSIGHHEAHMVSQWLTTLTS